MPGPCSAAERQLSPVALPPHLQSETLKESLLRHEHFLALRLGLKPHQKVRVGLFFFLFFTVCMRIFSSSPVFFLLAVLSPQSCRLYFPKPTLPDLLSHCRQCFREVPVSRMQLTLAACPCTRCWTLAAAWAAHCGPSRCSAAPAWWASTTTSTRRVLRSLSAAQGRPASAPAVRHPHNLSLRSAVTLRAVGPRPHAAVRARQLS